MSQQTFVFADARHAHLHADELARCIRSALATHGGEYVGTFENTVMLRIARATDAVTLSLAVVETLTRGHEPTVRAGIDTGLAARDAGRWSGHVVAVAARIAHHAERGQVLVTARTRQATDRGQIDFIGVGEHQLRDTDHPITLYRAQRITDHGPPVRLDIDPVCNVAVETATAVRVPGDPDSPVFCSTACADAYTRRSAPMPPPRTPDHPHKDPSSTTRAP